MQESKLFGWLTTLYHAWVHLKGSDVYTACKLAMAELIMSGCTTSSDHLYIYPNNVMLDDSIRAARHAPLHLCYTCAGALQKCLSDRSLCFQYVVASWATAKPGKALYMLLSLRVMQGDRDQILSNQRSYEPGREQGRLAAQFLHRR